MASLAPTLDPALRHAVLLLRIIFEDDITIWREVEIEASQPLWELDQIIQASFGWPHRTAIFLPKDVNDGEETYMANVVEDVITSETAPVGLLLRQPRDFAHYIFDVRDRGLGHRIRLRSITKRDPDAEYPRVVRSHGETPPIYSPDEYELDDDDLDIDLDDEDEDDEDDD
jgi:hypothetical protein